MIHKIDSHTSISARSGKGQAVITEIPRRWRTDHQNLMEIVPTRPQLYQRSGARRAPTHKLRHLVPVDPQSRITDVEIDPRQWLLTHNPLLAKLVTEAIGDRWMTHAENLQQLALLAEDPQFQSKWRAIKRANKQVLANDLKRLLGVQVNVDSLFDLQLQPIDGHQRQLLNLLRIVYLYQQIKIDPDLEIVPRTFIFGDVDRVFTTPAMTIDGESETPVSPSSAEIKLIITDLTAVLATDPDVRGRLQIVYVPQSAGLTTQMYRAADLTEQIAMAEMTDIDLSQLKFAINGVLSIGSMSKANHLLQQDIGAENCFSFGLAISKISLFKTYGYDPYNYYKYYPEIRQTIDALLSCRFFTTDPNSCQVLVDELLGTDKHMVLAEYIFYLACQSHVSQTYRQQSVWTRMSILNVAGVG